MKRTLILLTLLLTACATASSVVAEDNPEWLADKARLESLTEENRCEEQWNILWKWAKRGNMQARSMIYFLMVPSPDMAPIYAPGNSGDFMSSIKDIVVVAVHSHDYRTSLSNDDVYSEAAYELYKQVGFDKSFRGRKYLECVKAEKKDCAEVAVEEKLVPSFNDYAAQIDAFIAEGMTITCPASFKRIK
ncbi:MAG: hypothetical protein JAZ11_00125 [Candidatus Thiodiazotropha lotti]|nr:hypothetical protein [Candidatus Thiodiazotropha lotti]